VEVLQMQVPVHQHSIKEDSQVDSEDLVVSQLSQDQLLMLALAQLHSIKVHILDLDSVQASVVSDNQAVPQMLQLVHNHSQEAIQDLANQEVPQMQVLAHNHSQEVIQDSVVLDSQEVLQMLPLAHSHSQEVLQVSAFQEVKQVQVSIKMSLQIRRHKFNEFLFKNFRRWNSSNLRPLSDKLSSSNFF
jgi:hypothetical protein